MLPETMAGTFRTVLICCRRVAGPGTVDLVNAVELTKVAYARELCASGGLELLRRERGVGVRELTAAIAAEYGRPVAPSTVSRWARGQRRPSGGLAVALYAVAEALSEGDL
jgi:hypothetical protein